MPVFNNALAGAAGSGGAADFTIERSLRFDNTADSYLSRTPSSAGNRRTFTWSGWVKRSGLGAQTDFFSAGNSSDYLRCGGFTADDQLEVRSDSAVVHVKTARVFRDTSAWYHIVIAIDTTQSTSTDRVKFYVNGVQETSFVATNYPSQNREEAVNDTGEHRVGAFIDKTNATVYYPFDGYLADVYFIDGQALAASDFGKPDGTTGVWNPKAYSGSYGTNGFHLDFSDNSSNAALGEDSSGNNNDWTANNLTAVVSGLSTAHQGFDVLTYSGNSSSGRNITGLNFTPDFVWIKNRLNTAGYNHILVDSVRGAGNYLSTSSTGTESAFGYVSALNSGGFTVSNHTEVNASSNSYVAWCWKAGGTAVSNTDGSGLTNVQVSANNTYGFSIVTYTGGGSGTANTDSGDSFGHGLSTAPKLVICKRRTGGNNGWPVYHASTSLGALNMNSTGGLDTASYLFAQKHPTDSVVYLGNNPEINATGSTYVAYCWSEIPGFSKFGTFTHTGGNQTLDFGFTPRYWLVKEIDGTTPWYIFDAERDNFDDPLFAQSYGTESSGFAFTFSGTGVSWVSGSFATGTYIYAAFAAKPDQAAIDSLIDTPTNADADSGNNIGNYATLTNEYVNNKTHLALSNGNLDVTFSGGGSTSSALSTIGMSSGKYYAEFTCTASGSYYAYVGVANTTVPNITSLGYNDTWAIQSAAGDKVGNGSGSSYGSAWGVGDVIGVAFDATAGTVAFYKNGSSPGTAFTGLSGTYVFGCTGFGSWAFTANFGQRPFAYTPPTGYLSLCTQNLPDPTIADGSDYFDVVVDTGANILSSTKALCGGNADFLWIKDRANASTNHHLIDIVRDPQLDGTPFLASNSTSDETTLGTYSAPSGNSVGWAWDAGTTTDTNNSDGSITPTGLRANPSAGFSIVTYNGTGSNATFGHGLNAAPELVIIKCRSHTQNWAVYSKYASGAATPSEEYGYLNSTNGWSSTNAGPVWNNTSPTSSVVHVGTDNHTNASSRTYVAYCFAPVAGYSAFGSYTGNGLPAGPFVYTGFQPRWVMHKRTDTGGANVGDWRIWDTARDTDNAAESILFPSGANQESTNSAHGLDILSNGFKFSTSDSNINATSGTYIYAAFAENPFKTARAR